ncbi:MAG TPA: class I SAM-dependent methyltransferase [Solirubrobacteraceae bacterium]
MRIGAKYDGPAERVGGLLNLVPVPIGMSMFGMPVARSLQVAQSTGMLARLAAGPVTAPELARELGLRPQGTALVLDVMAVAGVAETGPGGRYSMSKRAAKWLSPSSSSYVGDFLADTANYWEWWQHLEELVRDGSSIELHDKPADDRYWRSYIVGQYQLARLSSSAVAKAVALPAGAGSLLDVAGAHGEFSMALCRRHDELSATVVDLPGSAAIGREIVRENGMSERVRHVEGNMFEVDLDGPHDGALAFNIIHHLSPEQVQDLFRRLGAVLRPGAPLCVLDLYDRPPDSRPDSGSFLGLFFHLTSGADTYSTEEVSGWLAAGGFGPARVKTLPQLPGLALLRAERLAR